MSQFNLNHIEFQTIDGGGRYFEKIGPELAIYIGNVGRAAWRGELTTWSDASIETLLPTAATIANPNLLVESGRFGPDQLFAHSTLSVAVDTAAVEGPKLIGYAISADDASGPNRLVERAKMLTSFKRHRLLGQIAVHPDYQRRGIGTGLSLVAFHQASGLTRATLATWPDEGQSGTKLAESLGLKRKEEKSTEVAGYNIRQVRYSANRAKGVIDEYLEGTDLVAREYLRKILQTNRPEGRWLRERKRLNKFLEKHKDYRTAQVL